MNSVIKLLGISGQPLSIDVIVGMRTARDLRSLLLDAAYALKGNAGTFLALLFKCGFTPQRLATELEEFKDVVRRDVADRVRVLVIDDQQEVGQALAGYVDAGQLGDLRRRIAQASSGTATSSSREAVQFLLLRRWLRGLPPIKTADLAAQCGASAPTVSVAIKAIPKRDVRRTRDRQVALQSFSPEAWQTWLSKSAAAKTVNFVDRSGSPRTPEKLARALSAMGRKDVALGGVLGAMHHYPALDITGAPRLDILVHGTPHTDLSFIEHLDPGLVRDDSGKGNAHVVVHFTNRGESYFEAQDGFHWADVLDCVVHLYQAGLTHQVQDLISHLTEQAKQPKEKQWTTA
jgi:hypothetical protein